jgi:hypothetical protein
MHSPDFVVQVLVPSVASKSFQGLSLFTVSKLEATKPPRLAFGAIH